MATELEACAEVVMIGSMGSGALRDKISPYCVRAESLKAMRAVPLSVQILARS